MHPSCTSMLPLVTLFNFVTFISKATSCFTVLCPTLAAPSDGSVTNPASRIVGSTAEFFCDAGFQLIGHNSLYCTPDGSWSNPAPECVAGAVTDFLMYPVYLAIKWGSKSGPEVIQPFPCCTQPSMEFQMLINLNISGNSAFFLAQISLECYFSCSQLLKSQQLLAL